MKIQPVRGTRDIYGKELLKYQRVEKIVKSFSKIYNFNEIITPIFESTELFKKTLGEHSDVVLKEMYTFKDRNDSYLTLRPEYTTPMIRAAISNNLLEKIPQKLFGIGQMFRRERPQKGRYRQFNQINFEILGTYDFIADVELILLANDILKSLFPNKIINLYINSLGNRNTLKEFKKNLSLFFEKYKNNLSEESKNKIYTNPIRILDSKNINDQELFKDAPKISDYYTKQCEDKFNSIQNVLSETNINYKIDSNLVRGLDYYCHTVFEFKSNDLGTQDTLIGGGRYDGLVNTLGGPDIPGVGWAGGIERIIMLMEDLVIIEKKIHLIIIDEKFKNYGFRILNLLRSNNLSVYFDYKYNLRKSLSIASRFNFNFALIIGENEANQNLCTIKNLIQNSQETVPIDNLIKILDK